MSIVRSLRLTGSSKRYFMKCAGLPPTIAYGSTSLVTTAPAATIEPLPSVTPEQIIAFSPIHTSILNHNISFRHCNPCSLVCWFACNELLIWISGKYLVSVVPRQEEFDACRYGTPVSYDKSHILIIPCNYIQGAISPFAYINKVWVEFADGISKVMLVSPAPLFGELVREKDIHESPYHSVRGQSVILKNLNILLLHSPYDVLYMDFLQLQSGRGYQY